MRTLRYDDLMAARRRGDVPGFEAHAARPVVEAADEVEAASKLITRVTGTAPKKAPAKKAPAKKAPAKKAAPKKAN